MSTEFVGYGDSILQALEWCVQPGTLTTLTDCGGSAWKFAATQLDGTYREHWFAGDVDEANDSGIMVDTHVPALQGVNDPTKAASAIAQQGRDDGY